ncbi:uncharacterized protein METZ01_LOCUS510209, partial [marine metagenome]
MFKESLNQSGIISTLYFLDRLSINGIVTGDRGKETRSPK